MKRVAAGAHLPTPWLFEPAERPGDRADYCLGCSFLPSANIRYALLQLGCSLVQRLEVESDEVSDHWAT